VFLLEPGDIHDGEVPAEDGFTYRKLYLDPQWLKRELGGSLRQCRRQQSIELCQHPGQRLAHATSLAFQTLHHGELKIVRQTSLDGLLERLTSHLHWRARYGEDPRLPLVAQKAREYLHANAQYDIGLDQLTAVTGVDRFRLTRAFKATFGMAPHAYLVQLRLATAGECWPVASNRRRWRWNWGLPIRVTWAAGLFGFMV
jgi:hypothetical protein